MTLRNKLIRLAHEKPELREDILPLLKEAKAPSKEIKRLSELGEEVQDIGYEIGSIAQDLEDAGLTSADLDNATGFCLDAAKRIRKSLKTLKKIK